MTTRQWVKAAINHAADLEKSKQRAQALRAEIDARTAEIERLDAQLAELQRRLGR